MFIAQAALEDVTGVNLHEVRMFATDAKEAQGVGYELLTRSRINAGAAVGVPPNAPAARLPIKGPNRFPL